MCLCTVEKQGPTFGYEGLYFVNSVEQPWRCIFGTMLDKFCHIGMIFLSWVCPASLAGCFLAFTSVVVE